VAEAMLTNLRDADQPPGGRPAGGAREAGHIRSPWEGCTCVIFGTAYDVGELDPVCPRHGAGRSPVGGAAPADYLDYLDSSYEVPPPSMCDATLISERDRVLFECDLRRGHDGPHTDKGCRWTTLPPTAPVPDPEAIDRAAREVVETYSDPYSDLIIDGDAGVRLQHAIQALETVLGPRPPASTEKETDDGPRYDLVGPERGPCGLCGHPDARHRLYDAIQDMVAAGDDVEATASDYGLTVETVQAIVDAPPTPEDDE
jgi:hypothetical protein